MNAIQSQRELRRRQTDQQQSTDCRGGTWPTIDARLTELTKPASAPKFALSMAQDGKLKQEYRRRSVEVGAPLQPFINLVKNTLSKYWYN